MTDSEIISAEALISALKQQPNLPIELQSEFHQIAAKLTADPDYFSQAIESSVALLKSDLSLPLLAAYQSARLDLKSTTKNNRKSSVDYSDAAVSSANSQEIRNRFRDELLIAGIERTPPNSRANFINRFLGKK
jgi:hypothetical protein